MPEPCPICEDSGFRTIERPDGTRAAIECTCRTTRRAQRMVDAARIPRRYAHCELDNYDTDFPSSNPSLTQALLQTMKFVNSYSKADGKGLLFVGRPGLGKTHLSVGLLRVLIKEYGAHGLFVDYRDLLKQVQNSYDSASFTTELGILRPVFNAEVLVIDDLGASKPSDWVFDTVAHILNSRYNDRLTTIITTNFVYRSETSGEELSKMTEAQRVMSQRTLGDRIGNRVLSRLQEMCTRIEMIGKDYRDIRNLSLSEIED